MTYDALGRWGERGAQGSFTQAVYSPAGKEFSLMSGQTAATAYIRLPGGTMARYENALDTYWHPDWLGTARLYSTPTARCPSIHPMHPLANGTRHRQIHFSPALRTK